MVGEKEDPTKMVGENEDPTKMVGVKEDPTKMVGELVEAQAQAPTISFLTTK